MPTLKPMTPLQPLMQASMKPPTPLQPKNARNTASFRPQRRCGFNPTRVRASKGDAGFRRADRLVYRTQMRYPWPAAGPGRATSGRPTLQTSSNQHDLNHLARTSVTNVVNLSPKTSNFSEKADGLTTFVTTGQKSTRKTPWIDDVCNNTRCPVTPTGSGGARLRCPRTMAEPGRASIRRTQPHSTAGVEGAGGSCRGAGGRWRGLAKQQTNAPSNISDLAPLVWRAPEGPEGTGGLRDRPLRAAGSRVAISRAAGPDGARNTSGAASNKLNHKFRLHRRRGRRAGGPPPTGTHSGRARRRPEHQRRHKHRARS